MYRRLASSPQGSLSGWLCMPWLTMAASGAPTLQKQLYELLSKAEAEASGSAGRPVADFCCSGQLGRLSAGLTVAGLGALRLPLGDQQAEQLKQLCTMAPYGKGEHTVVDPAVRHTWQCEPAQFTVSERASKVSRRRRAAAPWCMLQPRPSCSGPALPSQWL